MKKEQFVENFVRSCTPHLQACYNPGVKESHLNNIILMNVINASSASGYMIRQVIMLPARMEEITVLINEDISLVLPLDKRKEAING